MKQLFLILSVFVLAFGMTSCGGGYDLGKCKALEEKIDDGDELTQKDYAEMIDQAMGLCGFLEGKAKGFADVESFEEGNEYQKTFEEENDYYTKFMRTLRYADLNKENKEAFKELKEADKQYTKTAKEAVEKAMKNALGGAIDAVGSLF